MIEQAEEQLKTLRNQYQQMMSKTASLEGELRQRKQALQEDTGLTSIAEIIQRKDVVYQEGVALKDTIEAIKREQRNI